MTLPLCVSVAVKVKAVVPSGFVRLAFQAPWITLGLEPPPQPRDASTMAVIITEARRYMQTSAK
jgi:hypothetical protein